MARQRRSLVAFEEWLNDEVDAVQEELQSLFVEADDVAKRRQFQETKLETLKVVQARLAQSPTTTVEDAPEPVEVEPPTRLEHVS